MLIVITIFFFLTRSLIKNIAEIPLKSMHLDFAKLLASYICLILHFVVYIFSWKAVMKRLNVTVEFLKAFWIIATSQIAKYLPGGVWYAVGRVYLAKKERIADDQAAVSVVLETCLIMISGIVIILILFIIMKLDYRINMGFILILLFALLLLVHPKILSLLINIFLHVSKKPSVELRITYWQIIKISIYFFGFWVIQIVGFAFLVKAIYPLSLSEIPNLAAAYVLSWMTGFIVVFAPGGLGVREGMMTLLLSPVLPTPLAIAISFISRVWITIFEIVLFFVGLLVKKMSKRSG